MKIIKKAKVWDDLKIENTCGSDCHCSNQRD